MAKFVNIVDVTNFILFFAFYYKRTRRRRLFPIYVIFFLRRKTIDVENIMQFKRWQELQIII